MWGLIRDTLSGRLSARRINLHIERGNLQAAKEQVECLARAGPSDPESWRLIGRVRLMSGDYVGALAALDRAGTAQQDSELLQSRAAALHALGRPLDAASAYLQAYEISPDDHGMLVRAGECFAAGGLWQRAKETFLDVIEKCPEDRAALKGYLTTLDQLGQREECDSWLASHAGIHPSAAVQYVMADRLEKDRHFDRALEHYRNAKNLEPQDPEILKGEARCLIQLGKLHEANRILDGLIEQVPDDAEALNLNGLCFFRTSRLDDALEYFELAVHFKPESAEALHNAGAVLRQQERIGAAAEYFRRVLALEPDDARTLIALIDCDLIKGNLDEADVMVERLIKVMPNWVESLIALGSVRYAQGRLAEARDAYENVLLMDANHVKAHVCLGGIQQSFGEFAKAAEHLRRALLMDPESAEGRTNHALWLLAQGRYKEGWPEYEYRWKRKDVLSRSKGLPRWNGEQTTGRVLIASEQGLGDQIMFASCIPDALQRVGQLAIECHPKLVDLFARSFPKAEVVPTPDDYSLTSVAGQCDQVIPIGSLPLHFRSDKSFFPQHRGYLQADTQMVRHWRDRLATVGEGLKVGISWRGGALITGLSRRSLGLSSLLPLLRVSGAHFVSLQYHADAAEEVRAFGAEQGVTIHHWQEAIDSYDQTAALVTALDLVISVCTAVIHLGGALGRPVWVMVPFAPEWRYAVAGATMPWYPSVQLHRQESGQDWSGVVEEISRALRRETES